jgi:chromatin segregation and condensation protein Rec8/ScpA/Scc1 (kleisin family)
MGARFPVEEDGYVGPLHLLVHLAERHGLDLSRVRLGRLTAAYLEALAGQEGLELVATGAFLRLAARLIRLKAAWEDSPEEVPAEEEALAADLLSFVQVARVAKELAGRERLVTVRPRQQPTRRAATHEAGELLQALQRVRRRVRPRRLMPRAQRFRSLAELVTILKRRMGEEGEVALTPAHLPSGERAGVVLAALSLAHRGEAIVRQAAPFAPLLLTERDDGR